MRSGVTPWSPGIGRDGRPHLSPNWFCWDGQRFYVSTTRSRVKYTIFRRDLSGAQLSAGALQIVAKEL